MSKSSKKIVVGLLVLLACMIAGLGGLAGWVWYTWKMPQIVVGQIKAELAASGMLAIHSILAVSSNWQLPVDYSLVDYAITAQGEPLAKGQVQVRGKLVPQRQTDIAVDIQIEMAKIQELKKKHTTAAAIAIEIHGHLHVTLWAKTWQVPFHFTHDVTVGGRPFSISVQQVNVKSFSTESIDLALEIQVTSLIAKDIPGLDVKYEGLANKERVLQGTLHVGKIPAGGNALAEIPLQLDRGKLKAIKEVNRGKPVTIQIQGNVKTTLLGQPMEIPFEATREVVLQEKPFELKIKKIKILKLRERTFLVLADLINKTNLDIHNLAVDGQIILEDGVELELVQKSLTLRPGQTTELILEAHVERAGLWKLLRERLKNKLGNSRLKLKLNGQNKEKTPVSWDLLEQANVSVVEE